MWTVGIALPSAPGRFDPVRSAPFSDLAEPAGSAGPTFGDELMPSPSSAFVSYLHSKETPLDRRPICPAETQNLTVAVLPVYQPFAILGTVSGCGVIPWCETVARTESSRLAGVRRHAFRVFCR
jgi:hypothetical protein